MGAFVIRLTLLRAADLSDLSTLDVSLRLGAALVSGCVMGLNRDLRGKPAGVRTLGLVALGSALATMAASGFSTILLSNLDAISRAVQGIITGIGFLGAGVIIKQEEGHRIRGLTTAALIWLVACFGMIFGIGAWGPGGIALAMAIVLLLFGKQFEGFAHRLKPAHPDPDEESGTPT